MSEAPTIALVGGGLSVTSLFDVLGSQVALDHLQVRLVAQDHARVAQLVDVGRRRLAGHPGWTLEACRTLAEAVQGARVVVLMLRVGGLEARWADDQLAQHFGIPGDEGLGPAGAANALRTLPVIDQVAADLARLAPQATVLNLVAPLGLTTRALLDRGMDAIGVCELPGVTHQALTRAVGDDLELAYGGFNHLGWFWPVDGGATPPDHLIERLVPAVADGLVDPGVLAHFGAVPLKYYYWLHEPAVAERLGITRDPTRSRSLLAQRDHARADLSATGHRPDLDGAADAGPALTVVRPTPWFDQALVPMLGALLGGGAWHGYANLANRDLVGCFDPDVVVEVPVRIDHLGAAPQPPAGPMPSRALAFSHRVERSEQLLYAAWRESDRAGVGQSLIEGPHHLDPQVARRVAAALAFPSPTRPSPRRAPDRPVPLGPDPSAARDGLVRDEVAGDRVAGDEPADDGLAGDRRAVARTRFETTHATTTDYLVGPGAWHDARLADALGDRPVVAVIDDAVARHHSRAVDHLLSELTCLSRLTIRGGEQCKSQAQLNALLDHFEAAELPKHGVALGIGGGAVCDVVSLAALLMRRSVPLALLPTTLLAQVDAAVGGKNGIDSPTTKNVFGHFHHPLVVASDPGLLATLDRRQVVSGIAECIKVFAVADAGALDRHAAVLAGPDPGHPQAASVDPKAAARQAQATWTPIVADAQEHKLALLAEDPFEESSRRLLNYGHAFAHLLEERSDYRLLHGEAVLFGMMIENEISIELGIATAAVDDLQELIVDLVPSGARAHWLGFAAIAGDLAKVRQMRRAAMNLVCVEVPGSAVIVDDVSNQVLATAWQRSEDRLQASSVRAEALM